MGGHSKFSVINMREIVNKVYVIPLSWRNLHSSEMMGLWCLLQLS